MRGKKVQHKTGAAFTKYYKSTFEKTTEDRRQNIFDVAVSEFAKNGYNATNINVIAKKAGISIGAMYSYFDSKENLFLTIVDRGFDLLVTALKEVNVEEGDIFDIFERLLRVSQAYALNYPEFNQIYLDLTTQGLSFLSKKLSHKLESITSELYQSIINKAKKKGTIYIEADERIVSFCLDNLIVMFQFSFTSDYYKERMRIFLGDEAMKSEEKVIKGIMEFVKNALST